MIDTRLNRTVRLWPLFGLVLGSLAAGPAVAQTAAPRGPSEPQPRLSLPVAASDDPLSSGASTLRKVTHTVRRGETLSAVARRYGASLASVKAWNGLQSNAIQAGTRLTVYVPASASARTASARATSAPASRRPRSARARRAAAAALALREAEEPRFKLDENGATVPDLRAEAAIIYSPETGQVLWEENAQDQRSIASITKIMTAAVFLEDHPDLTREIVVQRPDVLRASTTYLRAGYKVTTNDLLHLLLIASDNAAARALARVSSLGSVEFVARMNEKAAELGLTNTHYADPSGLLNDNVSTAYDMARLIAYVANDERIAPIMQTQYYSLLAGRRTITVHSTNQLVMKGDVDVLGGKTGFIRRAGYCLATLLRLPQGGPQVAVVVLGARSNAGRFWETRHLFNWLATRAQDVFGTPVQAASN
ncbi:MAG: serine hydrolase [Acidobacteria bacterium]|nr:serine hydrolase [Acidobacteriota bacterium]